MEIRSLTNCDFETLFCGFERAFSDYEINFAKEEVRSMLTRRGFNPSLSFAAFDNGVIVAFSLTGTGLHNSVPTAYDIATGTAAAYRRRGLSAKLFNYALPRLREARISQYLLEVLQNNSAAISAYRKQGFQITRSFDCFRQTIDRLKTSDNILSTGIDLKITDTNFVRQHQDFCDFTPSWQNNADSIKRGAAGLICLGATFDGEPTGYCVYDPLTGDIAQIAVRPDYRHKGIATRLLTEAVSGMKTPAIKILNVSPVDSSLPSFLKSLNIPFASGQFEMILSL